MQPAAGGPLLLLSGRLCHQLLSFAICSSSPAGGSLLLLGAALPLITFLPGYRTADKNRVQWQDIVSHVILHYTTRPSLLNCLIRWPSCALPAGTLAPARACQVSCQCMVMLVYAGT